MIDRFWIVDHADERPAAERIAFCDGSGGHQFRPETDIELSHWRPNRTPARYRAGTSTEICFKFALDPLPGSWVLAVNNHLDVDGLLSVFALVHSRLALSHRETLQQAAAMGDFWGWGDPPAQRVFQSLTLLIDRDKEANRSPQSTYEEAFSLLPDLLLSSRFGCELDSTLAPLRQGCEWIESGRILRRQASERCTHYVVPRGVVDDDFQRATYVPGFNERISSKGLLWPHVRARWDAERVCLVSTEGRHGWYHDLWAPGYLWADTESLWQVPGLLFRDGMQAYDFQNAALRQAVSQLNAVDASDGTWSLGDSEFVQGDRIQEQFPLLLRNVDGHGTVVESHLSPDLVIGHLAGVFDHPA